MANGKQYLMHNSLINASSWLMAGEDVTKNAWNVMGIPHNIPEYNPMSGTPLSVLEVRGEVYMTLEDFQQLNAAKVVTLFYSLLPLPLHCPVW